MKKWRRIDVFCSFASKLSCMSSEKDIILSSIQALGAKVLPEGARLVLFGSQARNDAREDSDWDLLILLNDWQLQKDTFGAYAYPFVELGIWYLFQPENLHLCGMGQKKRHTILREHQ